MWVSYTDNQNEQTTARQSAGAGEIKEISMDRDTIIDGLRMTMDLCVFDPSTGEEIEPHLLNDINRATYDACKGALEILERLDTDPNTISRAKAIDIVTPHDDNRVMRDALEELPSAQPERIKARWLPVGMAYAVGGESAMWGDEIAYHACDNCWQQALEKDGEEVLSDFCPNCGAEMREVTT